MTRPQRKRDSRQLVILTGLSGSGKGSVLNTFEDLGFYCVDNLPVALIPVFSDLLYDEGRGEIERAALLVDAREGEQIEKLPGYYRTLAGRHPTTLVFIEASDEALLRRFSETRRPHPLGRNLSVTEGIREIVETLVIAIVLVLLVVFLFLQNWRATLIPMIAVPVSWHIGSTLPAAMLAFFNRS